MVETELEQNSKNAQVEEFEETNSMISANSMLVTPAIKSEKSSFLKKENSLSEKEQKIVEKIEKRVEKIQKKQETKKGGLTDRMKIGIVLAVAGVILIVLGGLFGIFYLLGVIAFLIGAILIIMELLEM
ncbi:MAG: hypothetical protein SNJ77_02360 [Cytophagales bacterium]